MLPDPPLISDLIWLVPHRAPPGYAVSAHLHHYYHLEVMLRGRFVVQFEHRRRLILSAGEALLTPPLTRHAFRAPVSVRHAVFKFTLAPRYWLVFGGGPLRVRLPAGLVARVADWARAWEQNAPYRQQQAVALATLCLIEIARARPAVPAVAPELDRFRQQLWPLLERIALEPFAPWSLAQLAGEMHLSPAHCSRCFRRALGQNPKQYLLATRLHAAAAAVMAEPPRELKDIGLQAGYATVHAFTHAFTKFFGVSPGAYRRQPARG